MAGRCVCQICTCGRHRCPHNRGTLGAEPVKVQCNLSEYTQKFKPHGYQPPRTSLGPVNKPHVSSEPFQGETTYSKSFYTKKPERIEIPKSEYRPPSGNFDFGSTYRKEFTKKKSIRQDPFRHPNQYVLPPSKFIGDTEYNTSFQGDGVPPRTPIRHNSNLRLDSGKVETTTTMKNDYRNHENFRRTPKAQPPEDNHDRWNEGNLGQTSYTADFYEKEIPPYQVTPKKQWEPPTQPFQNLSTYRNTYKPHQFYRKIPSYKPPNCYDPPKSPFMNAEDSGRARGRYPGIAGQGAPVGTSQQTPTSLGYQNSGFEAKSESGANLSNSDKTTTKETYRPWEVPARAKPTWGQPQLHTTDGPLEHLTSYREAFLGKPTPRPKPASNRAATTIEMAHGPNQFYKNTEYTDRYKHHKGTHCAIPKPHSMEIVLPQGTMDCKTTYNNDYTTKKTERTMAVNPALQRTSGDTGDWGYPSSYDTTYEKTYKGGQNKCPMTGVVSTSGGSAPLKKNTSQVEFSHKRGGHYYYTPHEKNQKLEKTLGTPINTSNNSAMREQKSVKGGSKFTRQLSPSPEGNGSSSYHATSPEVRFDTPVKRLDFGTSSINKTMQSTYVRPATPMPLKHTKDYHSDFMSDEISHYRDGMSYCEPNTTYNTTAMTTSLHDEALCTCNASCNNSNNPNDNNNDTITKNQMDMFNTEPVVHTIDLEPIFEVTSIMPSE